MFDPQSPVCLTRVSAPFHTQAQHALFALARLEKVGFGMVWMHKHEARHRALISLWLFVKDSPWIQTDSSTQSLDKEPWKNLQLSLRSQIPENNWTMSLRDGKKWRFSIWKYGSYSIDQVPQVCSDTFVASNTYVRAYTYQGLADFWG